MLDTVEAIVHNAAGRNDKVNKSRGTHHSWLQEEDSISAVSISRNSTPQ